MQFYVIKKDYKYLTIDGFREAFNYIYGDYVFYDWVDVINPYCIFTYAAAIDLIKYHGGEIVCIEVKELT